MSGRFKMLLAALLIVVILTTVIAATVFADPGDDDYMCPGYCGQQYCQGADGTLCPGIENGRIAGSRGCGGPCGGR